MNAKRGSFSSELCDSEWLRPFRAIATTAPSLRLLTPGCYFRSEHWDE